MDSIIAALISLFSSWRGSRASELEAAKGKIAELEKKLEETTEQLNKYEQCRLIITRYQPVLLVGPRRVGKSSLVRWWHSSWDKRKLSPTADHLTCIVHAADQDQAEERRIKTVKLKVHDFPGEIDNQQQIVSIVREEAEKLRRKYTDSPGIIIVCMFDAEEAHIGISEKTWGYYNGDLFPILRELHIKADITIERVILVFNRADKLRSHYPYSMTDGDILELCMEGFASVCGPIFGLVNGSKVCAVMTVLGNEDEHEHRKDENSNIVKGEAAFPLVKLFLGIEAAEKMVPVRASQRAEEVMKSHSQKYTD